jgi:hypothetical protein
MGKSFKDWLKTDEGRKRQRSYTRAYYRRNADKVRALAKLQVRDKEKNKKNCKEYYRANKAKSQEYGRKWRAENKEKVRAMQKANRDKHPDKWKARRVVKLALRKGALAKEPCIICKKLAEAHHADYSKPLDITWLCRSHHAAWHRVFKIEGE